MSVFEVGYDLSAVLVDDGPIPKDAFQRLWQSAPADKKVPKMWKNLVEGLG